MEIKSILLEVPLFWIYNYIMLEIKDMKNKELVIVLNMIGEWFSRGERGIDEWCEDVNVDKIRKVWSVKRKCFVLVVRIIMN